MSVHVVRTLLRPATNPYSPQSVFWGGFSLGFAGAEVKHSHMPDYSLRKPQTSDYDFLKSVHHITLKEHVSRIWGWDESAQDEFFKRDFESGQIQIIQTHGKSVGYLQLNSDAGVLHLVNLLILPEFQSRGLGTQIIRDLIAEAKKTGRSLKLGVFKVNGRAKRLYESLGFKTHGETSTHYLMRI